MTKMPLMAANAATTLIVLLASHFAAHAHDHNRPELNHWFESLKSGKGPCCSHTDGIAVANRDWDSKDSGYRVRLYGQWWGAAGSGDHRTQPHETDHCVARA